jgi:hypothetical protein
MARGGRRPGAGRPKGSRDRRSLELVKSVVGSGVTPLEYMISVMRNEQRPEADRFEAAKACAPYVHARLSTSVIDATHERVNADVRELTTEELMAIINGGKTADGTHTGNAEECTV